MDKPLSLPDQVVSLPDAQDFAKLYCKGKGLARQLLQLERQVFFLLMVEALHNDADTFTKATIGEENGEHYLYLETESGEDGGWTIYEKNEDVGGKVIAMMDNMLRHPMADDENGEQTRLCCALQQGITPQNCWKVARKVFGKDVGGAMEADYNASALQAATPESHAKARKPRM